MSKETAKLVLESATLKKKLFFVFFLYFFSIQIKKELIEREHTILHRYTHETKCFKITRALTYIMSTHRVCAQTCGA